MADKTFKPAFTLNPGSGPAQTADPSPFALEYETAMRPAFEAQRAAAESASQQRVSLLQEMLKAVSARENRMPEIPVPEVNPWAAGIAGGIASVNALQTGNNANLNAFHSWMQTVAEQKAQAEAQNAQNQAGFGMTQLKDTEAIHAELLATNRDSAIAAGDQKAAFDMNKSLYALQRQQEKAQREAQESAKQEELKTRFEQRKVEIRVRADAAIRNYEKTRRWSSSGSMTPEQKVEFRALENDYAAAKARYHTIVSRKDDMGLGYEANGAELDDAYLQLQEAGNAMHQYAASLASERGGVQPKATDTTTPAPSSSGSAIERTRAALQKAGLD